MTLTAPDHLRGPMQCRSPLVVERSAWVAQASRAGHSIREIREALGISHGSAREILNRLGMTKKPIPVSQRPRRIEAVAAFVAAHPGCRADDIVKALHMSANAVSDAFQSLKAARRIHATSRYTYSAGPAPDDAPEPAAAKRHDVRAAVVMVGETSTVHHPRRISVSLPREPWSDGSPVEVAHRDAPSGPPIRSREDWRSNDRLLKSIDKGAFQPRRNALGGAEV